MLHSRIVFSITLLASFATASLAAIYGPSEDTSITTGFGFNPNRPTQAYGTPFANLATTWESSGVQGFQYKLDITRSVESATSEFYFGAELKAKVGFYSGQASINTSTQRSMHKASLAMNLFAKVDFGTEYLSNITPANYNTQAAIAMTNPASWLTLYGTEVVTRRRRGAMVMATITFNSSNQSAVDSWAASFSAAGGGLGWSGSVNSNVRSLMTTALQTLNMSISVRGYGGNGFQDLVLPAGADPYSFDSYMSMINNYLANVNQLNSAITQYQTSDFTQFIGLGSDPFVPQVADAYLRYISVRSKKEALEDILQNAQYERPWMNPPQIAELQSLKALCTQRATEVWNWGYAMSTNPKSLRGRPLPDDIPVTFPRLRPLITTQTWSSTPGGPPTGWVVRMKFPGGYRLKGTWLGPPNYQVWQPLAIDPAYTDGTMLQVVTYEYNVNGWNTGATVYFQVFDEHNNLIGEFPVQLIG